MLFESDKEVLSYAEEASAPFASHPQHNGLALSLLLVLFNSLLKTFSSAHKDRTASCADLFGV